MKRQLYQGESPRRRDSETTTGKAVGLSVHQPPSGGLFQAPLADPFADDDPQAVPRFGTLTCLDRIDPEWGGYSGDEPPEDECPFCDDAPLCSCFDFVPDRDREPAL